MMQDLFIKPDIDRGVLEVLFTSPSGLNRCRIRILDGDAEKVGVDTFIVPGRENAVEVAMNDFVCWNIETPHLYTAEIRLSGEGKEKTVRQRFGMRKIECRGKWIYLNNKKIYIRSFIRGREAHDHPNLLNLSKEDYYAKNIRAAKSYGFNMVRFHSRIPEKECLEMADELGILIHVELRKYFGKYQKERSMMSDEGEIIDRQQWIDTVLSLRNHPSVAVYCMGNEIRHPGTNPYVSEISQLTRKLDSTRMFIDTCAHGEFDRDTVDFDVQHMSYFYPYGSNYDMFDHTYNWNIYGSSKGHALTCKGQGGKISRTLKAHRPILAHEVCHYVAMRDLDGLDEKFQTHCPDKKPWWLDELKKLRAIKGLEKDWPHMVRASVAFQQMSWKLGIEAARRSKLLAGFQFLQLSDTDLYENSNGLIDCFDDSKGVDPQWFSLFNADASVLIDLRTRTFFEGMQVTIPVLFSNFDPSMVGIGSVQCTLTDDRTGGVVSVFGLDNLELTDGLDELCRVELTMPKAETSRSLELCVAVSGPSKTVQNRWPLWVYPNCPRAIAPQAVRLELDKMHLVGRYPQLSPQSDAELLIGNRFTEQVFEHLVAGKTAMVLYRVDETRSRINPVTKRENYYLPATWDRFKGVIWDRGTNCGAFIRDSQALNGFSHSGVIDLQFHDLIDDCDKISLDDFPIAIEPIIQGVDKASRDRFDVYTYKLSELQPEWTMRKFAYLFELNVGKGRLLVCGLNLTGIDTDQPAACGMFESLLEYVNSDVFKPKASMEVAALKAYLSHKSAAPRIKERKMTQFWQLNQMPLESDLYWKTAERWITADPFDGTFTPESGESIFSKQEGKNTY